MNYPLGVKRGDDMKRVVIIALVFLMFVGCAPQKMRHTAINIDCFDTVTQIIAYTETEKEFDELEALVFSELERYHKLFDAYNSYEGVNNIKTINDNAGKEPIEVDPDLFELLEFSKSVHIFTKGQTNIAMGSVLYLWHEHRTRSLEGTDTTIPEMSELQSKNQHTDIEKLVLDEENLTVFLADSEMRLDVGAIAKGFVADKISALVRALGYDSVAISLGGNVKTLGKRADGKDWSIGIQDPFDENGTVVSVRLTDKSLVTSGDYQRFYYHEGKKYHHLIDPDTLMPAEYFSSVSVIFDSSSIADAFSTALFCMPLEEGMALVEGIDDMEALWITPDGKQYRSSGFDEVVK